MEKFIEKLVDILGQPSNNSGVCDYQFFKLDDENLMIFERGENHSPDSLSIPCLAKLTRKTTFEGKCETILLQYRISDGLYKNKVFCKYLAAENGLDFESLSKALNKHLGSPSMDFGKPSELTNADILKIYGGFKPCADERESHENELKLKAICDALENRDYTVKIVTSYSRGNCGKRISFQLDWDGVCGLSKSSYIHFIVEGNNFRALFNEEHSSSFFKGIKIHNIDLPRGVVNLFLELLEKMRCNRLIITGLYRMRVDATYYEDVAKIIEKLQPVILEK